MSYRLDNRQRDRKYGKVKNADATVETRELADKVSLIAVVKLWCRNLTFRFAGPNVPLYPLMNNVRNVLIEVVMNAACTFKVYTTTKWTSHSSNTISNPKYIPARLHKNMEYRRSISFRSPAC